MPGKEQDPGRVTQALGPPARGGDRGGEHGGKLGHAKAKTNYPVAEYRAEWGQLEALGKKGAAAREALLAH